MPAFNRLKRQDRKKIYHYRSPVKVILTSVGAVVLAALIIFLSLFFGLKKYAVYDDEGVRLEIPWLEGYRAPENGIVIE